MKRGPSFAWIGLALVCLIVLSGIFLVQQKRTSSQRSAERSLTSNESPNGGKNEPPSTLPSTPGQRTLDKKRLAEQQATAENFVFDQAALERHLLEQQTIHKRILSLRSSGKKTLIKQPSGEYEVLKGVYSVSISQLSEIDNFELIDKRRNEAFVKFGSGVQVPSFAFPVVYSTSRGTLGSVTGNISVELKEGASPESIAQNARAELIRTFPDQHLAFFKGSSNRFEELLPLIEKLSKEPSVSSVELEVREKLYVPH